MFDASDPQTLQAVRALRHVIIDNEKPIVLWIGAGVSRWAGYPGWRELADTFHSRYLKEGRGYDKAKANELIQSQQLPAFFELCRNSDRYRYNRMLEREFEPKKPTPLYERFIRMLSEVRSLQIVTTNVEELLEKHLPEIPTIQRTDVESLATFIQNRKPFVCKVHGSVSSIKSMVFTSEDYEGLIAEGHTVEFIRRIFSISSVVFLGYGLGDSYLLKAMSQTAAEQPLFGSGPHFAVLPDTKNDLPEEIQKIKYLLKPYVDHRAALGVLDIVKRSQSIGSGPRTEFSQSAAVPAEPRTSSSYFIADFVPPGTWTTSYQIQVDGRPMDINVGTGFADSEVPSHASTAMHDLIVGLICFDVVFLPLESLYNAHDLLGSEKFWELQRTGALRFVHSPRIPAIIFPDKVTVSGGDVGTLGRMTKEGKQHSVDDEIRRQLHAAVGKEQEAERLFADLSSGVHQVTEESLNLLPELVRGALLFPPVQEILGISEAFLPTNIPRWNMFPALRLAHLLHIGQICKELAVPATRIGFGGEKLVSTAFSISGTGDWAEEVASYVLAGKYNTDLGGLIFADPTILTAILLFRETQEGAELRKRIREILATDEASEFTASINAGLKRNVPADLLERSRDQLAGLLLPQSKALPVARAVWNNLRNSDPSLKTWRGRSLDTFLQYCRMNRIDTYDSCPCMSGDRVRFCCLPRLKSE